MQLGSLAGKAPVALGVSWHYSPKDGRAYGGAGKPLSGDLLSFGGLFDSTKAIPNAWKLLGDFSVEFEKLHVVAAIALHLLEENHWRVFRKQVFVHLNASCPTFMY